MANEGLQLLTTAKVKITKLDAAGNPVGVEEHTVELSTEEVEALWHSQQQA